MSLLFKQLSMKTFGKLKLLALSVLLVLGMSSCLKTDDSLNLYLQYPYILQNSYGEYVPQMRITGSEPLHSASLNLGESTFKFTKLNDYVWEIPADNIFSQLDTSAAGNYLLTATGTSGKTNSLTLGIFASGKKIGDIDLKQMNYLPAGNEVSIELTDSVKNADSYCLMMKTYIENVGYTMWVPYNTFSLSGKTATMSNVVLEKDIKYRFALGARNGSVIRIDDEYLTVTGGESASLNAE